MFSVCSQKFYKLKKESEKLTTSTPNGDDTSASPEKKQTTPRKRKAKSETSTNGDSATPTPKKARGRPPKKSATPAPNNKDDAEVEVKSDPDQANVIVKEEQDGTENGDDQVDVDDSDSAV